MTGKRLRNWLQNGVLVLLCALTLLQLAQLPLLQNIRLSSNRLFPQSDGGEVQAESAPLSAMFPAVNLMATVDSEHGRCGQLCLSADSAALQAVIPLFKEAIGSATETGQVADETFRAALNYPGLFLELTSGPLPLEVVAAWLGETAAFSREVRAMALTTGEDDVTSLYLLDGEGRIFRYGTALYPPAVRSVCEGFLANGGVFSYETGYVALAPYTVLAQEVAAPAVLSSERPAGYSAYNLLSALGFNAHTFSRYTESGGAEVVEESPRTLRIAPDGTVTLTNRGTGASNPYQTSSQGLPEVLATAWRLAMALTEGTGASPLFLQAVEETESGCVLRFRYQVDGVPVFFADGGDALSVVFQNGAVSSFTYRCRAYEPLEEEPAPLLPTDMAQAIAAAYPDAALSIGYVDDGSGRTAAQWRR